MFSKTEIKHLIIAWIVLGFCFSLTWLFGNPKMFPLMLVISLTAVGSGFIFHELAHKFVALKLGCWAEFRMWGWGLIMALAFALMSGGGIIFAAPGAVYIIPKYIWSLEVDKKGNGLIALAGPLTNLLLAFIFLLVYQEFAGVVGILGLIGFRINLWLAAFNLIPFMGLDGSKIFFWNPLIWASITIPAWIYTAYNFFT
ncbi:MAG: site-2 protease family protein [Candidatus Bathyarchaeota archaeon]